MQQQFPIHGDIIKEIRFVGYSYLQQGQYKTALPLFRFLATETEKPTPYDLQTYGSLLLEIGDPLQALAFLDKALSLRPQHAPTLLNRAAALCLLGYREEGTKIAQRLERSSNRKIADKAGALILAFGELSIR
jgi:tetratricopeptide (TPR) repeat protein